MSLRASSSFGAAAAATAASSKSGLCVRIVRSTVALPHGSTAPLVWEVLDRRAAYLLDSTILSADDLGLDAATLEEYAAVTASSSTSAAIKERRRLLEHMLNHAVHKYGSGKGK
jgi:hypothetical protein